VLTEATMEAEKKVVALFDDLAKQERPILLKGGIQVITLPPAESEKFLKSRTMRAGRTSSGKSPNGPELRKLLAKGNNKIMGAEPFDKMSPSFRSFP